MKFFRTISPMGLLFAGIGSVIGSGWLFGPLYAAQIAGPAAVLAWIIGGGLMIIIALTFAELGSAFPVAGGMIQFAQFSHGSLVSFMIGWMVWISSIAVAPVETMGLLQYVANYIPGLMISAEGTHILTHLGIFVAAAIMFLMCVMNYFGAQFFSRSNSIITAIKLIVPILTVILLIGMNFHSQNFHSEMSGGFMPLGWHGVFAALPLGGVIYSFIGSNTVLQLAGETKNPQRSIPLALIGSMLFCIVLYALLQTAFIGALTPAAFANGWSQLHFAGDTGPFSGLMTAIGLGWFVLVIYGDALISPFGTGFVFTASTARVSYGLSQIGFLPAALSKLTPKGVPMRCIMVNFCVGLLLFLPFPGWQKLVSFIISCFIVSYIIGPIALVGLRQSQPDAPRPFFLPFGKSIALIAFYICNLLIFWTGWQTVSKMMIALSIGVLFYLLYYARNKQHIDKKDWRAAIWVAPYFILMMIVSYLGTFGNGINVIPFGVDFGVIGMLTIGVFYLVLRSSQRKCMAFNTPK
jgi:amino acid transporter